MPSQYSINNFSPSIRDFLLNKNIVADTITNNSLLADLVGVGYPVPIENGIPPNVVLPSTDLTVLGDAYLDSSILYNQYVGNATDYTQINIQTNSTITSQQGPYTNNNDLLNGQFIDYTNVSTNSSQIREDLTIKNFYVDVPKQDVVNINTQVNLIYQNLNSYLDENNNLNIGGPSTQAADLLSGLFNGQGIGFNVQFPNLSDLNGKTKVGVLPNDDIRATLLGRVLGATGVINDTQIGVIGGQQLLAHIGYNSAFSLQQETLGQINLNPLTLIQGDPLVIANYQITTPKGVIGKALNFTANILGVQSPISLLTTSIFTFSNKLDYIGMGNIQRANEMLRNSGNGQVKQLIAHMNTNLKVPKINNQVTLRQGYSPGFTDGRRSVGENTEDGVNYRLYARGDKDGFITDFLDGKTNSPITSGNYERSKQISDDGWSLGTSGIDKNSNPTSFTHTSRKKGGVLYKDAFGWQDSEVNFQLNEGIGISTDSTSTLFTGNDGLKDKTLLSKTEKLFNSGKMRTLVSGHGIFGEERSQINSAVSNVGSYISKGSGVMTANAVTNGVDEGPENVFCRTWTTYDRYAQVLDLQKHRGLYGAAANNSIFRGNVSASVLGDNGFVKVSPYNQNNVKKYMFSIENLAWADDLTSLIDCETGPGDPVSGKKGRIMWFPPYDLSFSESTSANWEKHNFIGRGEPMYTYNNTERTGNLSWKIIIDHPNYLNILKDRKDVNDDYLASFFAGCIQLEPFTTQEEQNQIDIKNQKQPEIINVEEPVPPTQFNVFFPNDVYQLEGVYEKYEDGKCDDIQTISPKTTIQIENSSGGTAQEISSAVSYMNNGETFIFVQFYTSNDYYYAIYNAKTKERISITTWAGSTTRIDYDNKKLVSLDYNNDITFMDFSTNKFILKKYFPIPAGKTLASYDIYNDLISIRFSEDNNRIYIYDTKTGNNVTECNIINTLIHSKEVTATRFINGGKNLISTSVDTSVIVWDLTSSTTNKTTNIINLNYPVFLNDKYYCVDDNSSKVILGNNDTGGNYKTHADVYDYSIAGGKKLFQLNGFGESSYVNKYFTLDYTKILTKELGTNIVKAFDANNGKLLYSTEIETNDINDLYITNNSEYFISEIINGVVNYNYLNAYTVSDGKFFKKLQTDSVGRLFVTSERYKTNIYSENETTVTTYEPQGSNVYIFDLSDESQSTPCYINRKTNLEGKGFGLVDYNEMCYQFKVNGKDEWSSVKCASNTPPGTAGSSNGRVEPDRTDFGLNGTGTTKDYKNVVLDGKVYDGFKDPNYKTDLTKYLNEKCPNCRIEIVGYASTVGTFGDDRNNTLSKLRAEWVEKYLKDNILNETFKGRTKIVAEGAVEVTEGGRTVSCPASPSARKDNYLLSENDKYGCKRNRYVTVRFVPDPNITANEAAPGGGASTNTPIPGTIKNRLITECDYFEKLQQESKVVYDTIKEKIKYFQPAFHSTTPEGFNARLTFLQQCMRQGRTHGVTDNNNPSNLAFGRPPVCILRVGDFYNTKIIIDNITFDFEPLVWDLNPEGVGVQPMICNVNMSFSFIGGSSLNGPISKLQNALSYNYFANTEIYTDKADTVMNGKIVDGVLTNKTNNNLPLATDIPNASPNNTVIPNQENQNEVANNNSVTQNTEKEPKLTGIEIKDVNRISGKPNGVLMRIKLISDNVVELPDDKLLEFAKKGIKVVIDLTPQPTGASRYEQIIEAILPTEESFVDPEFPESPGTKCVSNCIFNIKTALQGSYYLGDTDYPGFAKIINYLIAGEYTCSLYYDNQKISSVNFTLN
jgi:hypothetical protein